MGIKTRALGDTFIITSDRNLDDPPSRAPKKHADFQLVWTGSAWSRTLSEAMPFPTEEEADEYTNLNYARISSSG